MLPPRIRRIRIDDTSYFLQCWPVAGRCYYCRRPVPGGYDAYHHRGLGRVVCLECADLNEERHANHHLFYHWA